MTRIVAKAKNLMESLSEEDPLRGKLASLIKEAGIRDDLFARASVLEGALGLPTNSLARTPHKDLADIQRNFPDINEQFFDLRRDYDLYGAVIGGASQIRGTEFTPDEIAQSLIAGLTIKNMDRVKGGSIYRRLGEKLKNQIKSGRVDMKGLAGTLRRWAATRAMDVIDRRPQDSLDEMSDGDNAALIDRFYSDPGTSETALAISLVNDPRLLREIDRAVRSQIGNAEAQVAVWEAIMANPGLLDIKQNGVGVDQQALADILAESGRPVSRQVAGRKFREKVLPAMQNALANDERLQQTLMRDREIQEVFQDAMRLASRTAEWKGWTEDMPVQVVTMRGTEVFPNLAAAQKKYRDLDPRRNGRKFTWAMKDRVKGRPAIRFEEWAVNKMMSMAASSKSGRYFPGPWFGVAWIEGDLDEDGQEKEEYPRFFLGKNRGAVTRWLKTMEQQLLQRTRNPYLDVRGETGALFSGDILEQKSHLKWIRNSLPSKDQRMLDTATRLHNEWRQALADFQAQGTLRSEDKDFTEDYAKNLRLARKVAVRFLRDRTACGPGCSCGGNCTGQCQSHRASEQEAEKLEAEAQANRDQAEADEAKAEAAQMKEAAAESGDFLDSKLERAWKAAFKAYWAWERDGKKTDERIRQNLKRDPDNFDYRQEMLAAHDQWAKEGSRLLKGMEAIMAAAKKHPIRKESYFRQAEDNMKHAKHGFKTYDPFSGKYQNDPQALHYKGSYGYSALMSAIFHLALARGDAGLPQQGRTAKTKEARDLPLLKEAGFESHFKKGEYLYDFFLEKRLPHRVFEKEDRNGVTHFIPNEVVIETIALTRGGERRSIEDTIRKIDFKNGDVNHFLDHLAGAIADQYSGALSF